jgi:hypothetical protein
MGTSLGALPSRAQKRALAGSAGSPDAGNEFVTKTDQAHKAPFGGGGGLGDVTQPTASMFGTLEFRNLTITGAITVPQYHALYVKCQGDFTNNSTMSAVGAGFSGGTAGLGPTGQDVLGASGAAPTDPQGLSPGGGGGSGGGGGGTANGGAGGAGQGSIDGRAGGAGGGAVSGFSNPGNAGGVGPSLVAKNAWQDDLEPQFGFSPTVIGAPGSGGGGGGAGAGSHSGGLPGGLGASGGVGGAGGGIIIIEALGNLVVGTISCDGVAGSAGSTSGAASDSGSGGGGGGGGGGRLILACAGTITPGTATANGGAGGAGGLVGGHGGNGGAGAPGRVITMKVAA